MMLVVTHFSLSTSTFFSFYISCSSSPSSSIIFCFWQQLHQVAVLLPCKRNVYTCIVITKTLLWSCSSSSEEQVEEEGLFIASSYFSLLFFLLSITTSHVSKTCWQVHNSFVEHHYYHHLQEDPNILVVADQVCIHCCPGTKERSSFTIYAILIISSHSFTIFPFTFCYIQGIFIVIAIIMHFISAMLVSCLPTSFYSDEHVQKWEIYG